MDATGIKRIPAAQSAVTQAATNTAIARAIPPIATPTTSAAAEFSGMLAGGMLHGLAASIGLGDLLPSANCMQFVNDLQNECGGSGDPLVALLLQQIGVSQAATGLLASKAAAANNADHALAYSTAAARLLGELRRCVATVAEIRSGGPRAPVVNQLVAQQNVAAGPQQVAFVAGAKKRRRKPD